MRWIKPHYKDGDIRIHTFFAWFPISIDKDDMSETRWLTRVTVKQKLSCNYRGSCHWINIEFIGEITNEY